MAVDATDSSVIRLGTSDGAVMSGRIGRGWRLEQFLGSPITSISTATGRFVVTSFGPDPQAVFATTSEALSLASITLRPRGTSIWTSSLSDSLLALGCDEAVLCSRDPVSARMDVLPTGGSAVYALEQDGSDTLLAGTRSGVVHAFDLRSTTRTALLDHSAAITHVRRVGPFGLVVAAMDGHLVMHDVRAMPTPLLSFRGHVNKTLRDGGLAVYGSDLLAVAGQDRQVRLWDLHRGGAPLRADRVRSPWAADEEPASWLVAVYEEPVTAMVFSKTEPALLVADGATVVRCPLPGASVRM